MDQITALSSLLYHYTFREVLVSNLSTPISPQEIPLFNAPTLVSQFGATWVRDARDNPAAASKGNFNSSDFCIADTGLSSTSSFWPFFYQHSPYYPSTPTSPFSPSIPH